MWRIPVDGSRVPALTRPQKWGHTISGVIAANERSDWLSSTILKSTAVESISRLRTPTNVSMSVVENVLSYALSVRTSLTRYC